MSPIPMILTLVLLGPTGPQAGPQGLPTEPQAVRREAQARFREGVREAERLRRRLLEPGPEGDSSADRLAAAIARFPGMADEALRGRPGLDDFRLSAEQVVAAIRGVPPRKVDPEAAFGPFEGRWFGLWEQMPVDHHWEPVEAWADRARLGDDGPFIFTLARQYAWVGDGYGWNVVAVPQTDRLNQGSVILGFVWHVVDGDPTAVRLRRPHVGVHAGPGMLVWITGGEVFFEQRLEGEAGQAPRYAITGFRYREEEGRIVAEGDAFQAIYTRSPDDRPAFFRFPMPGPIGGEGNR